MKKFAGACIVGAVLWGLSGSAHAWVIDFDTDPTGGSPNFFAGGTVFGNGDGTSYQRYTGDNSGIGLTTAVRISADNSSSQSGHPDKAVGYPSGGSGGRDDDLEQNFIPVDSSSDHGYGNILIVQENYTGCSDGVCNYPDDEAAGGHLYFDFDDAVTLTGMNVFDIEQSEANTTTSTSSYSSYNYSYNHTSNNCGGHDGGDDDCGTVKFYNNSLLVDELSLPVTGDHGVAFMSFGENGILADRMEICFIGSGAIDNVTGDTPGGGGEVPEPTAMALFGVGLAGLGIYRRRRRAEDSPISES